MQSISFQGNMQNKAKAKLDQAKNKLGDLKNKAVQTVHPKQTTSPDGDTFTRNGK